MPHSLAIAEAVVLLSPVTILTVTPDFLHYSIAAGTSGLIGSLIPAIATRVISLSRSSSGIENAYDFKLGIDPLTPDY